MAGQVVQSKFGVGTGAGTAIAQTANPTAGNAIVVVAFDKTGNTTFGISDTIGNSYNRVANIAGANATQMAVWVAVNSTTAANTVTVTATVTTDGVAVMAAEISGLTTLTGHNPYPVRASLISNQVNPGTAADAVIASSTGSGDQCFELALGMYEVPAASNTIAAGTGFTSTASGNVNVQGWSAFGYGTNPARLEWKSGVPAGTVTGSFTDATNGAAATYLCALVAFDEFNSVGDDLTTTTNTDLITYNSNWSNISNTVVTNAVVVGTTGAFCSTNPSGNAVFATYAGNFTADQQAQFVYVSNVANARAGVGLRMSNTGSGPNGYMAFVTGSDYNIIKCVNNVSSSLIGGTTSRTNNPGDVFLFTVQGSTLQFWVNGVQLKTLTDTTFSSGSPGIAFNGGHPSTVISTFRAGSLGTNLTGQTLLSSIGQLGDVAGYGLTARTGSFAEGSITNPHVDLTLQTPNAQLMGQSLPASGGNGTATGQALSWYTFTATTSGVVTSLNAYINNPLAVTTFYLSLYDSGGNQLAVGSTTPVAGLNQIAVAPVTVIAGQQYELAWKTAGGNGLILANDAGTTAYALSSNLVVPPPATLPPQTGQSSAIGQASIFVTGTGTLTAVFLEGQLVNTIPIGSQTATFTEGTLTASTSGNLTFTLGSYSLGLAQGLLFDQVSYLLDQGASFVNLFSQTATFAEGVLAQNPNYTLGSITLASTEGTITRSMATSLGATSATFTEGVLTANTGSNATITLIAQAINSSLGTFGPAVIIDTLGATSASLTEGALVFSKTQDFTVSLAGQGMNLIEGIFGVQVPQGTGPPLFIPPQLGKPVTTRTFSWADMAERAWGSEFRAPDHRIYQFSGGNYKDSTDMGTTGIYSPNLGTPDNP